MGRRGKRPQEVLRCKDWGELTSDKGGRRGGREGEEEGREGELEVGKGEGAERESFLRNWNAEGTPSP